MVAAPPGFLYSIQLLVWLSLFLEASRNAVHVVKCQAQRSYNKPDVEKKAVSTDLVEYSVDWRQVVHVGKGDMQICSG